MLLLLLVQDSSQAYKVLPLMPQSLLFVSKEAKQYFYPLYHSSAITSGKEQKSQVLSWTQKKTELIDWKMFSKIFLVKKWWINKNLWSFFFLFFFCPQDQVIFVGEDETPKSPISSWVEKGGKNHSIPTRAHALLFTQSGIRHGREVERALCLLTSRASAGHAGGRLDC